MTKENRKFQIPNRTDDHSSCFQSSTRESDNGEVASRKFASRKSMSEVFSYVMRRLVAMLTLFSAFLAAGRMMPPPVLNPKDYRSPSGEFVLTVDPTDMYGRGSATYRLARKGNLIWSGEKPFTLYEAGITDKGVVAGYAYTHGIEGHARTRGEAGLGDFHVVVMGSTGELILDEVIPRKHSRFLHEYPNPTAKEIRIDGAKNQATLLINDPDVNRRQDVRWTYQLSSGRLLSKSTSGPQHPAALGPTRAQARPASQLSVRKPQAFGNCYARG